MSIQSQAQDSKSKKSDKTTDSARKPSEKSTSGRNSLSDKKENPVGSHKSASKSSHVSQALESSPSFELDENIFTCNLPEDLICEIIEERLKVEDCKIGLVFDGIDCSFIPTQPVTLQTILKALGTRKHIYMIDSS